MSCVNSPQRGSIDYITKQGKPLPSPFSFRGIIFVGWRRAYVHGCSRTDSCRGQNRSDVAVLRYDRPKEQVDPSSLSTCRMAVLLRKATAEEHHNWTANGNLCTVELLQPFLALFGGNVILFSRAGRKDSYAEQF